MIVTVVIDSIQDLNSLTSLNSLVEVCFRHFAFLRKDQTARLPKEVIIYDGKREQQLLGLARWRSAEELPRFSKRRLQSHHRLMQCIKKPHVVAHFSSACFARSARDVWYT